MSIITRINKAEKRIVDLYNKLKNLPSGGGGVQTISGNFVDNTDPLNPILNDPRPYKVYTALLSQSGTDAPVAIVLENTLGGEIVWSRDTIGQYEASSSITFTQNTIGYVYNVSTDAIDTAAPTGVVRLGAGNKILLTTADGEGNKEDDLLFYSSIEIRVYN